MCNRRYQRELSLVVLGAHRIIDCSRVAGKVRFAKLAENFEHGAHNGSLSSAAAVPTTGTTRQTAFTYTTRSPPPPRAEFFMDETTELEGDECGEGLA
ncbi:MAG: hypothetical protein AAB442_02535, partial [Patescibacteria group bacterium]